MRRPQRSSTIIALCSVVIFAVSNVALMQGQPDEEAAQIDSTSAPDSTASLERDTIPRPFRDDVRLIDRSHVFQDQRERGLSRPQLRPLDMMEDRYSIGTLSGGPASVVTSYQGTLSQATPVPIESSGERLESRAAMMFLAAYPLFSIESLDEVSGRSSLLSGGPGTTRTLVHNRPEFDVDGSLLRVGYAGSVASSSRIELLFARNVADDLTLSVDLQRIASDGLRINEEFESLFGVASLDWFSDGSARMTGLIEVGEIEGGASGGLGAGSGALTTGPVLEQLTMRSLRHRRAVLSYRRYNEGGATTLVASNHPWLDVSLFYRHEGWVDHAGNTDTGSSIVDFAGIRGAIDHRVGDFAVRASSGARLGNGRLGGADATVLAGLLLSGRTRIEVGGAFVADSIESTAAVAIGLGGNEEGLRYRVDGRFYPGGAADGPIGPVLSGDDANVYRYDWVAEGRFGIDRDGWAAEFDGDIGGLRRADGESALMIGVTGRTSMRLEPVALRLSASINSFPVTKEIVPLFSSFGSVEYRLTLLNGALDLLWGIDMRWGTEAGYTRYDVDSGHFVSRSNDRQLPIAVDPLLGARVTARIGSAFFTLEGVNLLGGEYLTLRRYPASSRGLNFGLNWTLID